MGELNAILEYQLSVVGEQQKKVEEVQRLQESDLVKVEQEMQSYTLIMEVSDIDEEVNDILDMSIVREATISPMRKTDDDGEVIMQVKADLDFDIQDVASSNYPRV